MLRFNWLTQLSICAVVATLSACGGGGGSSSSSATTSSGSSSTSNPAYTIGGTVSGLTGAGLVLQNNSADDLAVSANGAFTFSTAIASSNAYSVTVKTQPTMPAQTCTVTSGTGTASAAVTTVVVSCVTLVGKFLYVPNPGSNNISAYTINAATGALTAVAGSPFAAGAVPKFLQSDNSGSFLYVANQGAVSPASGTPTISGFSINATSGALTELATSPFQYNGATLPAPPAASGLLFHPSNKFAYAALFTSNTGSGLLYAAAFNSLSGDLSGVSGSPYMITTATTGGQGSIYTPGVFNATGSYLYVSFGYAPGNIKVYAVDAGSGALSTSASAPTVATGGAVPILPRMHPTGKFLYVANFSSSSTSANSSVAGFAIDPLTGALTAVAGSPFATGGTGGLLVTLHPNGRFLYVGNGNAQGTITTSTVAAFAIDSTTGVLTPISGSPFSTNGTQASIPFIDPSGKFLYILNQGTNTIEAYTINQTTGALTEVTGAPFAVGNQPSGLAIDSSGKYLYFANSSDNTVSAYAINATTGTLTLVATVPTGTGPLGTHIVGLQ